MTEEFNLSKKICFVEDYKIRDEKDVHPAVKASILEVENVKEFIKRLKDELTGNDKSFEANRVRALIDKLAGDKLTK